MGQAFRPVGQRDAARALRDFLWVPEGVEGGCVGCEGGDGWHFQVLEIQSQPPGHWGGGLFAGGWWGTQHP